MLFFFFIFCGINLMPTIFTKPQQKMFNKHMSFLYTVQIVHPGLIVNVWKIKFIEITNALNLA